MVKQPIAILGIDLGKNSCSVAGCDDCGRVVLRRRLTRDGVVRLAADLPACVMAMEACCGAHHLGRVLCEQGHEVRLMSPEYVQPYVKAQKNDERDAEAIAEAATRPTMRFVQPSDRMMHRRDRPCPHRSTQDIGDPMFDIRRMAATAPALQPARAPEVSKVIRRPWWRRLLGLSSSS